MLNFIYAYWKKFLRIYILQFVIFQIHHFKFSTFNIKKITCLIFTWQEKKTLPKWKCFVSYYALLYVFLLYLFLFMYFEWKKPPHYITLINVEKLCVVFRKTPNEWRKKKFHIKNNKDDPREVPNGWKI